MTVSKPSTAEDEFFAREDAEKKRRLALQLSQQMAQQERDQLQALHRDHCPACGQKLSALKLHAVAALRCFSCNGVFLSADSVDQIVQEPGYWQRMLHFFAARDYSSAHG